MKKIEELNGRYGRIAILAAFILMIAMFAIIPLPGGDDWKFFHGAAQRVLQGAQLYDTRITFSYFYYMPWLAVLLSPLGLLPLNWGWSIISVISIFNIFLLCKRWNMGVIKLIAILFSPPMLYTLLQEI